MIKHRRTSKTLNCSRLIRDWTWKTFCCCCVIVGRCASFHFPSVFVSERCYYYYFEKITSYVLFFTLISACNLMFASDMNSLEHFSNRNRIAFERKTLDDRTTRSLLLPVMWRRLSSKTYDEAKAEARVEIDVASETVLSLSSCSLDHDFREETWPRQRKCNRSLPLTKANFHSMFSASRSLSLSLLFTYDSFVNRGQNERLTDWSHSIGDGERASEEKSCGLFHLSSLE